MMCSKLCQHCYRHTISCIVNFDGNYMVIETMFVVEIPWGFRSFLASA